MQRERERERRTGSWYAGRTLKELKSKKIGIQKYTGTSEIFTGIRGSNMLKNTINWPEICLKSANKKTWPFIPPIQEIILKINVFSCKIFFGWQKEVRYRNVARLFLEIHIVVKRKTTVVPGTNFPYDQHLRSSQICELLIFFEEVRKRFVSTIEGNLGILPFGEPPTSSSWEPGYHRD